MKNKRPATIVIIRVGYCSTRTTGNMLTVGIAVTLFLRGKRIERMLTAHSGSCNRSAAIKEALAKLIAQRNYRHVQATYNNYVFTGTLAEICAALAPLL